MTLDGVVTGDRGTHAEPDAVGEVEIGFGLGSTSVTRQTPATETTRV